MNSEVWLLIFRICLFTLIGRECNGDSVEGLFKIYIRKFGKTYSHGSSQYLQRLANFRENIRKHKKLNEYHRTVVSSNFALATFGLTKFSDLSAQEFSDTYLRLKPNNTSLAPPRLRSSFWSGRGKFRIPSDIPKKIDWRKNSVTPVKNQKSCGACWAFSLVETIESMNQIRGRPLEELSVQQVINCAEGDEKCEGGDIQLTADWMIRDKVHLTTEKSYPLKDLSGTCNINPSTGIQVASRNSETNFVGREGEMLRLLVKGPLAVAVDAKVWQNYIGGVIQNNCYANVDHAVQIVGYDISGPTPFYIVRNSWGESFGENGYLYIKVGSNICGIGTEAVAVQLVPNQ